MKAKSSGSGNPRGRGTYNPACDVCARKKTKCDGNKPVCAPCRAQGRELECAWTKNPVRKPRTEQHFEAMHKRAENLQLRAVEWRKYADYLESLLDQYQSPHDFRASRPSDADGLLGPAADLLDHELDLQSDDGTSEPGDPAKELCIPTQTLKLEDNGLLHHYGNTAPFRFDHVEPRLPSSSQPSRFPALAQNPDATYVLLVDNVPDDHYNPDFDWSRHLPDIVPLDRRSHDRALDLIFKFFTSWCLRVVPALFLRDMYRALSVPSSHPPPKTPHYSPMLHNALIALGLAFVDDPKLRDLKSRQYFANKAKSYVEIECSKPNLSVVNALSILASFHSSKGDQTLGYLFFGMSARMAQALGLNVDCSEWVKAGLMDESDLLDRRWTYWTTFTQDVCWSLYVGREFSIPSPTIDNEAFKVVSLPLVDTDCDQLPWVHAPSGLEPQPNYLTKTFEATCELLMIARRVMDVVNRLDRSHSRPHGIDELITEIDLNLNTWKGRLSPELDITHKSRQTATPHKLMMHLAYWWLFILLHRPFFQRKGRMIYSTDREIDHVKLCKRAAENTMELLSTWRTLYTLRFCPITLIQTVFAAGTVYLLTAMQASSGVRIAQKELTHSLEQQERVLGYLGEIGRSWGCATNIAGIMRNLMEEQRRAGRVGGAGAGGRIERMGSGGGEGDWDEGEDEDDGGGGGALMRVRRHSSLIKPKPHRALHAHSRGHSVNDAPSPASVALSSPTITISHSLSSHQDNNNTLQPHSSGSSPSMSRSAPIAIPIQVPSRGGRANREALIGVGAGAGGVSVSPAGSFSTSLTDPWLLRASHAASGSASPVVPSPVIPSPSSLGSMYAAARAHVGGAGAGGFSVGVGGGSFRESSGAFAHRDNAPSTSGSGSGSNSNMFARQQPAAATPVLDTLAFSGSGHTASHMFQGPSSAPFDITQDLPPSSSSSMPFGGRGGASSSSSSVLGVGANGRQFDEHELSAFLGMPGGGALSTAPYVGMNFGLIPGGGGSSAAERGYAFESPSFDGSSSSSAQFGGVGGGVDGFLSFMNSVAADAGGAGVGAGGSGGGSGSGAQATTGGFEEFTVMQDMDMDLEDGASQWEVWGQTFER